MSVRECVESELAGFESRVRPGSSGSFKSSISSSFCSHLKRSERKDTGVIVGVSLSGGKLGEPLGDCGLRAGAGVLTGELSEAAAEVEAFGGLEPPYIWCSSPKGSDLCCSSQKDFDFWSSFRPNERTVGTGVPCEGTAASGAPAWRSSASEGALGISASACSTFLRRSILENPRRLSSSASAERSVRAYVAKLSSDPPWL